jgi:signal transduction histidine kinase
VIRSGVHQMLVDLREVIGLLREDPAHDGEPAAPPTLAGLATLVEEARTAGAAVRFEAPDPATLSSVPTLVSRTAYRVVQEGLTNARKHAPGLPVTVTLTGAPGSGVGVEVRQPLPEPSGAVAEPAIPGSATGLTGLAERAVLAGGALTCGPVGDHFVVHARLPWEG